jgi:hypothetical protein
MRSGTSVPSWPGLTRKAVDSQLKPHAHQDRDGAGEKSSPSPCGRGLGGGVRRPEVGSVTHAISLMRYVLARPLPPTPLPQGEGENLVRVGAYSDANGVKPGHDDENRFEPAP